MRKSHVKRYDPLTPLERSARMAKILSKGNCSTEMRVAAYLIRNGFRGWKRHPVDVTGHPDFCFVDERVAVFVDGCFWHGCPRCRRNVPRSSRGFWRAKLETNRRRDRKVVRVLSAQGFTVLRIWEHALADQRWLDRLRTVLSLAVQP